jgi:hypothetical protein
MQCPRCQSDDIKRSRRKLWERFVLHALKAQVYRCRDCKHRYWVGVQWSHVILGAFAAVVVAGVIATMVIIRHNQNLPEPAAPPVQSRRRRRVQPLPPGLPPLSAVPRPAEKSQDSVQNSK